MESSMQDSWGHTQGTSSDSFWGPKGARRQPWACKSPSSLRTWHEWQYLEMTKFPDPQQAESRVRRLSQARKTESKLQMKNQINQKKSGRRSDCFSLLCQDSRQGRLFIPSRVATTAPQPPGSWAPPLPNSAWMEAGPGQGQTQTPG